MTSKADFTEEEWTTGLQGPPSAGMMVVTAQRGGSFRETIAMAKSYSEARKQHGESELLDEITSTKPHSDHTHYHSEQELKEGALKHIRAALQVLGAKATPEEVEEYKQFVLHLADNVAIAHREGGEGDQVAGSQTKLTEAKRGFAYWHERLDQLEQRTNQRSTMYETRLPRFRAEIERFFGA